MGGPISSHPDAIPPISLELIKSRKGDPIPGTDLGSSLEQETKSSGLIQLPLRLRAIRTRKEQELIHALYRMGLPTAMAAAAPLALAKTLQ